MSLVRWKPREFDRALTLDPYFDRFFDLFGELSSPTDRTWYPALDLVEEKDRLIAEVELPGVDPKKVEVNLQGDTLTIKGERRLEKETEEGRFLKREHAYGSFQRTVQLPYRVDVTKVKASYKNGIMSISMPKAEEFVGRQIPVEVK